MIDGSYGPDQDLEEYDDDLDDHVVYDSLA